VSDPKIEAVQRLYEAYGRADLEAVLAELADDVDWAAEAASASVPWFGSHRGKAEVARFFKEIGSAIEVTEFTPLSFTANDTDVIAAVRWAYTVPSTGKRAAMHMQHWWRFADGKIVFFRGSEDTEQSAAAFSAETGKPDGEAVAAVRRFYSLFAAGDLAAADDVFADDCRFTMPTGAMTKEEHRRLGEAFSAALPDAHMVIDHVVDGGDELVVEGRFVGTHTGDLQSPQGTIPASGNTIELRFADYFKTSGGRIADHRSYWDQIDMMTQLGAMPGTGGGGALPN